MVNCPMPGSTRFFSVSMPVTPGPLLMSSMCVSSSATCPLAPQRRSCRSYFFSFAVGKSCSGGGVVVPLFAMLVGERVRAQHNVTLM